MPNYFSAHNRWYLLKTIMHFVLWETLDLPCAQYKFLAVSWPHSMLPPAPPRRLVACSEYHFGDRIVLIFPTHTQPLQLHMGGCLIISILSDLESHFSICANSVVVTVSYKRGTKETDHSKWYWYEDTDIKKKISHKSLYQKHLSLTKSKTRLLIWMEQMGEAAPKS